MSYPDALAYLYSRLPVFHRVGPKALKPGLTNIIRLCEALGNPHNDLKCIHVGGTNGKGSSSHMLAAIYQSAGYRTGLYTSPHLKSFTERIRVDGSGVDEAFVARFVTENQLLIESIEPSFFEVTVAMAFQYFREQNIDLAVIEVGLGGRLDSTNIIQPLACLITNIGWDHSDVLGDTLTAIAGEKAGIIKYHTPVVIGEHGDETDAVFRRIADLQETAIRFAPDTYQIHSVSVGLSKRLIEVKNSTWNDIRAYELGLTGSYQVKNVAGVLNIVECLQSTFPIPEEAIAKGLRDVIELTGLKGRWQVLQHTPAVVCDTAHNEPGMKALIEHINEMTFNRLHLILGCVRDKDVQRVIRYLPASAVYYFCQPEGIRALPGEELQSLAALAGLSGSVYADVNIAIQQAVSQADSDDLIVITGSNYLIAEVNGL